MENVQNTAPAHKKKRRRKKKGPIRKTLTVIGMVLLSLILIAVISVSIIAAALTVYVMQFREKTPIDIDLDSLDLAYTTFIYGYDEDGQEVELTSISHTADRIPVSIERIPRYVRDAFVYIEDERFYEHAGVDWKRTFGAFVNLMTKEALYGNKQGGSTITQQLVKNVTGDDDARWDRKLREIFRASDLEKYRDKDDILEAYLNCIGFGGNTSGIQAASLKYFNKDVSELDLAEAACLAAIPKSPEALNPRVNPERNKERQELVLRAMYNNAAISKQQYEAALAEELVFYDPSQDEHSDEMQNWYVDMVIRDVTLDLCDLYGVDMATARAMLYDGGYSIYTPVDIKMQEELEAKYRDYTTFSSTVLNNPPLSAFAVMDYTGNVLAVVGNVGEKSVTDAWNHATMSPRQPGSSFKPVAGYGYSIENDLITWSTIHSDLPIEIDDPEHPGQKKKWPTNYSSSGRSNVWSGNSYFTYEALQRSLNTVSARLVQAAGSGNVFEFVQNRFRFSTLKAEDADLSPMSVGALTDGVTVRELVAAYQVFGNGGKYFAPASYTYVQDPSGDVILQHKYTPIQSISDESAYVMNKLMQQVVEGPNGTGRAAKLENVPVVGKTGTSQNWADNWFVCCTPDYVSGVWYGYEDHTTVPSGTYYGTAQLWKNIFGDIAERSAKKQFPECDSVKELYFCSNTGMIASSACPAYNKGYYKSTNTPPVCTKCGGFTISDKNIEPVTTTIAADLIDIDELTNELLNSAPDPNADNAAALAGN
ncbi:MAG: transglycosylase domain-containing protein [Ruminococcus sp.]|nr:transglycosylase domain-containing protein [Ruminococcus sp.]